VQPIVVRRTPNAAQAIAAETNRITDVPSPPPPHTAADSTHSRCQPPRVRLVTRWLCILAADAGASGMWLIREKCGLLHHHHAYGKPRDIVEQTRTSPTHCRSRSEALVSDPPSPMFGSSAGDAAHERASCCRNPLCRPPSSRKVNGSTRHRRKDGGGDGSTAIHPTSRRAPRASQSLKLFRVPVVSADTLHEHPGCRIVSVARRGLPTRKRYIQPMCPFKLVGCLSDSVVDLLGILVSPRRKIFRSCNIACLGGPSATHGQSLYGRAYSCPPFCTH
jgi:hypothetical protein